MGTNIQVLPRKLAVNYNKYNFSQYISLLPREKWHWQHFKNSKTKRGSYLFRTVNFCPHILILSRDLVPLINEIKLLLLSQSRVLSQDMYTYVDEEYLRRWWYHGDKIIVIVTVQSFIPGYVPMYMRNTCLGGGGLQLYAGMAGVHGRCTSAHTLPLTRGPHCLILCCVWWWDIQTSSTISEILRSAVPVSNRMNALSSYRVLCLPIFCMLKVVGNQKVGGQECVYLSHFVSDRSDRCSCLYRKFRSLQKIDQVV